MPLDNPFKPVDQAWQAATLQNGWANNGSPYNNAAYWLDVLGIVHLEGVVNGGSQGSTIFTLPVGYRPAATGDFVVFVNGSATTGVGKVNIASDGTVVAANTVSSGTTVGLSLDGITFRIA